VHTCFHTRQRVSACEPGGCGGTWSSCVVGWMHASYAPSACGYAEHSRQCTRLGTCRVGVCQCGLAVQCARHWVQLSPHCQHFWWRTLLSTLAAPYMAIKSLYWIWIDCPSLCYLPCLSVVYPGSSLDESSEVYFGPGAVLLYWNVADVIGDARGARLVVIVLGLNWLWLCCPCLPLPVFTLSEGGCAAWRRSSGGKAIKKKRPSYRPARCLTGTIQAWQNLKSASWKWSLSPYSRWVCSGLDVYDSAARPRQAKVLRLFVMHADRDSPNQHRIVVGPKVTLCKEEKHGNNLKGRRPPRK